VNASKRFRVIRSFHTAPSKSHDRCQTKQQASTFPNTCGTVRVYVFFFSFAPLLKEIRHE